MDAFTKRANELVREVWNDLQRARRERELEEIKADPAKHRLTRIMGPGASTGYSYHPAGKERIGKRREERWMFCVAKHKNAAGVYLMWRQVERYKLVRGKWSWHETQRFDFQWSMSKKELHEIAAKKAARLKTELQHKAAAKLPHAPAEVYKTVAEAIRSMAN